MNLKDRLERVEYQILKQSPSNPNVTFSEKQLLTKVRSIYDAAINSDNILDFSDAILPLSVMGVSVKWSPNNTAIEASLGDFSLVDSLIDERIMMPVDNSFKDLAFHVNGDVFFVNNDYFFTDTDWETMVPAPDVDTQQIYDDFDNFMTNYVSIFNSQINFPVITGYDSTTKTMNVDANYISGPGDVMMALPDLHINSNVELSWSGIPVNSPGGSTIANDTMNGFEIYGSENGSKMYLNTQSGEYQEIITMSFDANGQTYTMDYTWNYFQP